jgi:hypothetical protein
MKNLITVLSFLTLLSSCKQRNTKIKERIIDADSVAINFFKGDGTMDTVLAVRIITERKTIEQLSDLIGAASIAYDIKCGYDGSLHFFKRNTVVQDIDFRMNDKDCMCFSFKQEGKIMATVLSPVAKELLETIRK